MMGSTNTVWDLFGGPSMDTTKVDFSLGAKTESYLPLNNSLKQEQDSMWIENFDIFGETYDPFEEALLPENIDPEQFIQDLDKVDTFESEDLTPIGLSANPFANNDALKQEANFIPQYVDYSLVHINNDNEVCSNSITDNDTLKQETSLPHYDEYSIASSDKAIFSDPFANDGTMQPDTSSLPQYVEYSVVNVNDDKQMASIPSLDDSFESCPVSPISDNEEKPKITINLKKVCIPSKKNEKPIKKKPHLNDNLTIKEAFNLGCADEFIEELMEIVQPPPGKELEEFTSYIADDEDSDDSAFVGSPLSYSSSSSSSPSYRSPSYEDVEDSVIVIGKKDLLEIESRTSPSNQNKASQLKRLGSRRKLSPEEKKLKKMEQNKRAAIRYRQKKKAEEQEANAELRAEEKRKEELTAKYKGLKHEVKVMKKLMRDFFIAKGIISANAFKK